MAVAAEVNSSRYLPTSANTRYLALCVALLMDKTSENTTYKANRWPVLTEQALMNTPTVKTYCLIATFLCYVCTTFTLTLDC